MISINPVITTNAAGTFSISLDGFIQGFAQDDPAVRYQLTGGQLASGETLPMFGGVPIHENFPSLVPTPPLVTTIDPALGLLISRATAGAPAAGGPVAAGVMTGVSVFNQNHAMINSPQSPVPQADIGMLVNYYRFGSRARIAFAMDPAFNPATPPASTGPAPALTWDVANQRIGITAAAPLTFLALPQTCRLVGYNLGNSMTIVYDAITGFATWNRIGNACLIEI
jgi:hypothetical protein